MNYFVSPLIGVLELLVSIYLYILLLRFILNKLKANYFNPVVQGLVKVTDPLVKPLRRVLPSYRGYDLACAFIVLVLQVVLLLLPALLTANGLPSVLGFILVLIGSLGIKLVHLYITAIIIQAVMSWFPSLSANPVGGIVYQVCEPLMRRVHRVISPMGGIDFSPIIILLVMYILKSVVFYPLIYYGYGLG